MLRFVVAGRLGLGALACATGFSLDFVGGGESASEIRVERDDRVQAGPSGDRKSTRLNSSHVD